jgi:hypothetical protein
MGADQFGHGGSRKIPASKIKKARQGGSHAGGGGGGHKKKDCCPMVAAVRSAKQGKFKLARRYAGMSVRLIAARVA